MVRKVMHILLFVGQLALTMATLMILYMTMAIFDTEGGIDGLAGLIFFHPISAMLCALVTVVICGLAGLFIRLNPKVFRWWTRYFFLDFILIVFGFVLVLLSASFTEIRTVEGPDGPITREVPNAYMFLSGWFLLAFGLMHLFPPHFLLEWLMRTAERIHSFLRKVRSVR